jgi:hypothetical protein
VWIIKFILMVIQALAAVLDTVIGKVIGFAAKFVGG